MKQTQGRWDPKSRGIYFTAGVGSLNHPTAFGEAVRFKPMSPNLFAVNDFAAPGQKISRNGAAFVEFRMSIDNGCPTFLDSGIFFLTNEHKRAHGTTMDEALALAPEEIDNFEWLWDVYLELCSEFGDTLWGFNELDQGGMANKIRTRARIEAEGLRPIPVYHPLNDGWDYFDDLAQEYDRMCFGNVVQANRWVRKRLMVTLFERHRSYPDLFVHILGMTPNEIQAALPFDSADSSTWTRVFRYPQAMKFTSMAKAALPQNPASYIPWGTDTGERRYHYRMTAGDLSVIEATSLARSLRHWQDEIADTFALDQYPSP